MTKAVEHMKRAMLRFVTEHDGCTFPDMIAAIPGAEGEYAHELADRNVIIWAGLSEAAAMAITDLFYEHEVFFLPAPWLTYAATGKVLNLPIAKSAHHMDVGYREPHWLPVVLSRHHPMPERAEADFAKWDRNAANRAE